MSEVAPAQRHYFVDEADDPVLFDAKGRALPGQEGCSRHFILGVLDVADPEALGAELETLRLELLADPYFRDVPSMQPERRKTAWMFHAKDDVPEVRREVFRVLMRHPVQFLPWYATSRPCSIMFASVIGWMKGTATNRTTYTTPWWRGCSRTGYT
jgi:hypothetical protein